jgi:hypothetical protein
MDYKTTIHNVETGEIITRSMTQQETEQYEKLVEADKAYEIKKADEANQKAALLERLGITADEAKLLLA